MKKTRLFFCQSGQTLVEAVVVIGMVILLVTGLISGTTASLKSAQSGKVRSEATKWAEDGMEVIRSLRDNNWSTIASDANSGGSVVYCFGSDGNLDDMGGSCPPNITTSVDYILTRTATFAWLDDGITVHVHVAVSYMDGETTKTVPLDTYLTEWR